jgi:hypothetical protein
MPPRDLDRTTHSQEGVTRSREPEGPHTEGSLSAFPPREVAIYRGEIRLGGPVAVGPSKGRDERLVPGVVADRILADPFGPRASFLDHSAHRVPLRRPARIEQLDKSRSPKPTEGP